MRLKNKLIIPAAFITAFSLLLTTPAQATVVYLPDVTAEMTKASYWTGKQDDPTGLLADRATIDSINAAGISAGSTTRLQDLKNEPAGADYYTATQQTSVKKAAGTELSREIGKAQKLDGSYLTQADVDLILDNYLTDGSAPQIPSKFAIVTRHTTMRAYPTDTMIGETRNDRDDDNLYLSALCVNEPLVVRTVSADGKFMLCKSFFMDPCWVPTEDIAICADKSEWLSAWDIPAGSELVVTGYKVRTEKTRQLPNTSDRMLYMGTVLERIDGHRAEDLVGTRSAYYNHVCYLPVRDEATGNYSKEPALIAQSADVNEGFLPLTKENIAKTAFKSLGQMYGWGGMLDANDCSGYVRDVYKCFGLNLARNTTWQQNMPVCKYDLTGLDDDYKAAAIAAMPLGTVLFFRGHEMIYLGQEDGKLYVISSLGSIGNIYGTSGSIQIKSVAINTLDMIRGNRSTWLHNLTAAVIPYVPESSGKDIFGHLLYDANVELSKEAFTYNGKKQRPTILSIGGKQLIEGKDYTVEWSDPKSKKAGRYSLTITGIGEYSGQTRAEYLIAKADLTKAWVSLSKRNFKYNGGVQKPVIKRVKGKKLTEGEDYTAVWSDPSPTNAGTYTVTITGTGLCTGQTTATFNIKKVANPLKIRSGKVTISPEALASSSQTLDITKIISFTRAGVGSLTYTKKSGNKAISVDETGMITVDQGLKKGTYSVRVKVKASGDENYKEATKTTTVKIMVK